MPRRWLAKITKLAASCGSRFTLKAFGSLLEIDTLPDPILGTGEVIVDVAATAAPGPIDCVLDLLPPLAGTRPVRR